MSEGEPLAGRYHLTDHLGEGPASTVSGASDLLLDRYVAVKVLDGLAEGLRTRRALRAARLAFGVRSPHVVTVLDIQEGDPPFLVLSPHTAQPLVRMMRSGPLPPGLGTRLADEILAGLAELHEAGIVHRDVRAENVMVTPQGHALLTSGGLTEAAYDPSLGLDLGPGIRREGNAPSPEQEHGLPPDAQSDVYAAATLVRALAGGELPAAAGAVLDRAAAPEGSARPPHAGALRAELASARTPARSRKPGSRARLLGLALAGVAAAGLVGSAVRALPASGAGEATATADVDTKAAAFERRLAALPALDGRERAAEVADLYGIAAEDAAAGAPWAELARDAAAALRHELTLDGLLALVERDPAVSGPSGDEFVQRLRALPELVDAERAIEAAELSALTGRGTVPPPFARAAREVLVQITASATAGASASAQNP